MPLPNASTPQHANAQELAYATLRAWIMQGPLQPGELLRDSEIAERLGVSRTPVREALIRLAQEGLVEVARGRGTRVADLRLDRAPYLYQVGAVLDGFAAELATAQLTETDHAELHRLLAEMEKTEDPVRLADFDEQFHAVYYRSAGNPVLTDQLTAITDELNRIERHAWGHAPIRTEAHQEHHALVDAFVRRDPPAAGQAARENWRRSWTRIATLLGSSQ